MTDCPLSTGRQTRNLIVYSVNVGLIYLGASVLYVGLAQAALLDKLGASKTIANLPSSAYFWMTPVPIIVAWYFCAVRQLKPVLVGSYLLAAMGGAGVAVSLLVETPDWARGALVAVNERLPDYLHLPVDWVVPALIIHAATLGCVFGIVATYQWEVIGKGVADHRRGRALALAFGVGPILAFVGSLASQLILTGTVEIALPADMRLGLTIDPIEYPKNFAILFGATVPMMALAALLSMLFTVPAPSVEPSRPPFVSGLFGGLGDFLSNRNILIAAIATILVASGYNILNNMSLFTEERLGSAAEKYIGYQQSLRFGFKAVAGLFLGWLLTRTHAKAGLLVTGAFCLASVAWVLLASGQWFLLSFGIMGMGELFGVYYPNYILCCSAKSKMRRNMAFTSMLNMPSGFAPLLFGQIADRVGRATGDKKFGFEMSFWASIAILAATLLLVQFALPARPRPRESDFEDVDRAPEKASPITES
ncbi:MAG TPA: MFS transporter, partial [Gemmataceae bacterium]|nr:MFS transporter [Gemmataceae bacterium]